jgi:4-hydroxybenzoate polyprenyltransferase
MTIAEPSAPPRRRPPLGRAAVYLRLLRPYQWVKNAVVLLPALAVGWNAADWARALWAVSAFCVASSIVYAVNDVADRARDALHPVKRHRPVASGAITPRAALAVAFLLGAPLAAAVVALGPAACWPLALYLAMNVAYSRGLKHVAGVDVLTVAIGFALRLIFGYVALGQPIASWLVFSVLCLTAYLSLGKRRSEQALARTGQASAHRPALSQWPTHLLDHLLVLTAALAVSSFFSYLHTAPPLRPFGAAVALVSAPFALFALFRYTFLILVEDAAADPTRTLLRDRAMFVNTLLWSAATAGVAVGAHLSPHLSTAFGALV